MRWMIGWLLAVAACGDDGGGASDASAIDTALDGPSVDAPIDAIELDACGAQTLLAGGVAPAAQGWTVTSQNLATVTLPTASTTRLATSTATGASIGGLLLLSTALAAPFAVEVTMQVERVDNHNPSDAAVAFLWGYTPPFGLPAERDQMVYVDALRLGWADDSARADVAAAGRHVYRFALDAAGTATVSRDGTLLLTRTGVTSNGTIAIGDQTNDARVDAVTIIESITIPCP